MTLLTIDPGSGAERHSRKAHVPVAAHRGRPWVLRAALTTGDLGSLALGWGATLLLAGGRLGGPTGADRVFLLVTLLLGAGYVALVSQGLYLARLCSVRAAERVRLLRAVALTAVACTVLQRLFVPDPSLRLSAVGAVVSFLALATSRSLFRNWLTVARTRGEYSWPIVMVGTNSEAVDVIALVGSHPELGYRIVGVVGPRPSMPLPVDVRWLGETNAIDDVLAVTRANGAIIAVSSLPTDELNDLSRNLLARGVHVHLSTGLTGVAHRRLRAAPLAHEPFFYLEPTKLATWQLVVKRTLDIVLAGAGLVLASPILAVAALAVKLGDRGPVLYRHVRIGQDGQPFEVYKLRTMVVGADRQKAALAALNARSGPLFKAVDDPRTTSVGRLLRETSIDELPQLINVLQGRMSLVGPRPALAEEVEQFDDRLRTRQNVRPGITGLWQVEARDNPSFFAYRHLDIFYVENWSVILDIAILVATVEVVVLRCLDVAWRRIVPSGRPAGVLE